MSNSISLKFSIGQLPLAVFHILLPIMIGSYTYKFLKYKLCHLVGAILALLNPTAIRKPNSVTAPSVSPIRDIHR